MRTIYVAILVLTGSSLLAADPAPTSGVFVADQGTDKLMAAFDSNASDYAARTSPCGDITFPDGKVQRLYRVVVSMAEYAAGWEALAPARKEAAKTAAETERWDYEKWTEREKRMFKLLVQQINLLRQKAGLAVLTKEQVVEALKTVQ